MYAIRSYYEYLSLVHIVPVQREVDGHALVAERTGELVALLLDQDRARGVRDVGGNG